jgi:hypothetical protein
MVVTNRFGKLEQHPASMIPRAEVANFAKFHKQLNLEVPGDDIRPGRPDGFSPL